jgi:copper chaperone CopZ
VGFSVSAEENEIEVLWGKQIKGWGHSKNAEKDGNKVTIKKTAEIIKVEGNAKSYCIWSGGKSVKCGSNEKSIVGETLPAGTYTVLPGLSKGQRSAKVSIHMEYADSDSGSGSNAGSDEESTLLWGKQIRGWGHTKNAEKDGNKVTLKKTAKIVKVEGNAKRYCIWSGGKSVLCGSSNKSIIGQSLSAGTYTVLPGLSNGQRSAKINIYLK